MNHFKYIFVLIFVVLANGLFANNVKIENVRYYNAPNIIKFEISWENSWYLDVGTANAPNNWDAVWVFIKTQKCTPAHSPWSHVKVSTNAAQHSTLSPSTLKVDAVDDGMGVFVRRPSPLTVTGSGIVSTTVTLKLDNSNTYDFKVDRFQVMGIEMVAVLEGGFEVGDNEQHSFKLTQIGSETAVINAGALYNGDEYNSYNSEVLANFPKGFNRFYIMKYEVTQEQYVGFLNLLTYNQQIQRTTASPGAARKSYAISTNSGNERNGIQIDTSGTATTPAVYGCNLNNNGAFDQPSDGQNIACNYLKWTDLLAYLDWAALRPMTELEFEKAARGPKDSDPKEYAWGNATIKLAESQNLTNSGKSIETSNTNGVGLCVYSGDGPLRVGFAATQATNMNRRRAGASYWGVMELSGNVWEQAYSVGHNNNDNNIASQFIGSRGDGVLSPSGESDQADWSLEPKTRVVRGGSFETGEDNCRISDRGEVNNNYNEDKRYKDTGGRGVRQF